MDLIKIDDDSKKAIEDILNRKGTVVIYHSKKGLVVAEQSTKIRYTAPSIEQ